MEAHEVVEHLANAALIMALPGTAIEDAAAEVLSEYDGYLELELNGLTELSDAAAESLSKNKGDLALNGLTSLSDAAAESLSKYKGNLCLDLNNLPASAAKILRDAGHGEGDALEPK